ncbi:MUTS homolog 6 isoform X2 [Wolffia australiana]
MSQSRRLSNGRSPLVRKQSQITAFFSPGKSSPDRVLDSSAKSKKSKLENSSSGKHRDEAVGRRIKVFWPLDKAWYEGQVKSFDRESGKHVILYDDAEEEALDLSAEKIQWIEESPRNFRRLRRRTSAVACLLPDASSAEDADSEKSDRLLSGEDTMEDADFGDPADGDVSEGSDEIELDVEDENRKGRERDCSASRKRKKGKPDEIEASKKEKAEVKSKKLNLNDASIINADRGNTVRLDNALPSDAIERFGKREAEKFTFLCERRRDASKRRPGDSDYDPKTLYLPPEFLKGLSGAQRQWWEFKSKHMDKVLFFKMGKFYELFEMDAHVGAKELDLQYMKGDQPHCGFPEKNFSINLEKLVRKGYRALVVEQTETPEQLELRRKEMGSKDKVVKREICAVVSKGTLTEGELLSRHADASYLLSLTENSVTQDNQERTVLGICAVDVCTNSFFLGQFEDDSEREILCALLSELRPVEIIKPSKVLSPLTERALQRYTRCPLINELIPFLEFWNASKTIEEIQRLYQDQDYPSVLSQYVMANENGHLALSAVGGCLFYLRQCLLDESLIKCAKFESIPLSGEINNLRSAYMTLDAAALQNLEVLENKDGIAAGTLLAQLDHCATAFGRRLLKSWLARPLYNTKSIVDRQDAVAFFKTSGLSSALEFRKDLAKLPDMERLLARIFASCEANGRNASNVILYEDASRKQLSEFISCLRGCEAMAKACSSLSSVVDESTSSLLLHLLTPGKGIPGVDSLISHFKDAFDWADADVSGRIIPRPGVNAEYDSACKTVRELESSLARYLTEQRKHLGNPSINFANVGKETYLLEVPDTIAGKISDDYELRSSKKGYFRFWTPKIKNWLAQLSQAEAEKESNLKSILKLLIKQFSEHHSKWRQLVLTTAELDVLICLAIAGDHYGRSGCRPRIIPPSDLHGLVPSLVARSLGHPVLLSESFVPNDVLIGGAGNPNFILLTGPNMGGKSTLLRQICLAVILAQIGADVPADSFDLCPVDRIFVRMGASDLIFAGRSTFLTELTETASMLSSATCNSLVVLDELGRGTSTSDGQAIA